MTAQDYNILREGLGVSEDRTIRDVAISVVVTAAFSMIGFFLSVDLTEADNSPNWAAIVCICVAAVVIAASAVSIIVASRRIKRAAGRRSFTDLCSRIESDLSAPEPRIIEPPDDPS